jgi:6-phosphofructokinase 1
MAERPQRVCIVSGGGDAPGVNAVLRGFVHAARRLSIDVLGSRYGFEGLLAPDGLVPLTTASVRGILPLGGCMLGCSTRINPFYVPNGASTEDRGPAIVDRLRAMEVDALVLIGGDGTTLAAERFSRLGMKTIAIPKTIDDDLAGTDICCGFESAVETVTRALDALHATAEAHARVMLVEVMGRNAGWIALHAGVAGGADVILVPEIPYRLDRVIAKIKEREALGLRFSIVVVAEGARPLGGDTSEVQPARPGHLPRLGGAGARLLHELESADIGHEVRLTVLGHLQRGGSPSPFDRNLGTLFGTTAAALCHARRYDQRLVFRDGRVDTAPLSPLRDLHRLVDASAPLVAAAHALGIELGSAGARGVVADAAEPQRRRGPGDARP